MPNWVTNRLEVSGSPSDLERLCGSICSLPSADPSEPLDFERVFPTPVQLLDETPVGTEHPEFPAWREWRTQHWGTKWNVRDSVREGNPSDGRLVYRFLTAWTPAEPIFLEISRRHPEVELSLEYLEEFLQFSGRSCWHAGALTSSEEVDPMALDWVDWQDEEDEPRGPLPLPQAQPVDPDLLDPAVEFVTAVVDASQAAQFMRRMGHGYADWTAPITEHLGRAARCVRLMDAAVRNTQAEDFAQVRDATGTPLLHTFCHSVALAVAEALYAANSVAPVNGLIPASPLEQLTGAIDAAMDGEDRPLTESSPADWLTELMESLGYVTSSLAGADQQSRSLAYRPRNENDDHPWWSAGEQAQRDLLQFAGDGLRTLAYLAPKDLDPSDIDVPVIWEELKQLT